MSTRPIVCHMDVPLREGERPAFEQSIGEVDLDDRHVVHVSLANDASAVYFYKVERKDQALIPIEPIFVVEMADIMRMGAEMIKKGVGT